MPVHGPWKGFNAFDPAKEYGLPEQPGAGPVFRGLVFRRARQGIRSRCLGRPYKTVISAALEIFGWDMLLEAAGMDPARFRSLERDRGLQHPSCQAWRKTSIEVYLAARRHGVAL